ncbi:Na+/H+ antiporter subunit B [Candidatus Nitrospira bockiana]
MRSLVLALAAQYMLPLLLAFSVFLLVRGHDAPGGGFAGGLVASAAVALYLVAHGPGRTRRLLPIEPRTAIAAGLCTAAGSGIIAVGKGEPFLTGQWVVAPLPVVEDLPLGTPLLFDVGVYLVVIGVVVAILLSVAEVE